MVYEVSHKKKLLNGCCDRLSDDSAFNSASVAQKAFVIKWFYKVKFSTHLNAQRTGGHYIISTILFSANQCPEFQDPCM